MLSTTPTPLPPPAQGTFQVIVYARDERISLQAKLWEQTPTGEQVGIARWQEATTGTPKVVFQVLEQVAAAVPHQKLTYVPIPWDLHERRAEEFRQVEEWRRAQGKEQ